MHLGQTLVSTRWHPRREVRGLPDVKHSRAGASFMTPSHGIDSWSLGHSCKLRWEVRIVALGDGVGIPPEGNKARLKASRLTQIHVKHLLLHVPINRMGTSVEGGLAGSLPNAKTV